MKNIFVKSTLNKVEMKALVLFDTTFGNTKIIANAISSELGNYASAIKVNDFPPSQLKGVQLIIVGSPIVAWKPSERMVNFLAALGNDQLKGIKAVAFDTRVKLFIHGDAATMDSSFHSPPSSPTIIPSIPPAVLLSIPTAFQPHFTVQPRQHVPYPAPPPGSSVISPEFTDVLFPATTAFLCHFISCIGKLAYESAFFRYRDVCILFTESVGVRFYELIGR